MKFVDGLAGAYVPDEVRMPTVIQDHDIDINGWHEGNALLTPIRTELKKIEKIGVEEYVKGYFYNHSALIMPLENENPTEDEKRKGDGAEILWEIFLKSKIEKIDTVLDVGCGRGQAGIWFATAGKNYVGIDIALINVGFSIAMLPCLKYLKPNCIMPKYYQMLGEDLYYTNITKDGRKIIHYGDNDSDLVFSSHSLEHMHDFNKAFSEQIRVGKSMCGIVARPTEGELGEHMWQINADMLIEKLSGFRSKQVQVCEKEIVFWGEK